MSVKEIDRKTIESLLPHREPMLLIDKLTNIVPLKSATAIMFVKKNGFYVQGHFPDQPVMPGVLIVEAFGQAAAALTAHGIDRKEYENKVQNYNVTRQEKLMSIDRTVAESRNEVLNALKPILEEISNENGITILLEKNSVLLNAENMDITEEALKKLNKKLPSIEVSVN